MNSSNLHFRIAIEQVMGGIDPNLTTEEVCRMVESTFNFKVKGETSRINGVVERRGVIHE
jgi:hypothetical protein